MGESARPIRLLHVDDDPALADLAADFVSRIDDRITVESAVSASDGLDLLEENQYDCVLSDYDMPGLNGVEFLKIIREDDAELPFILFTGKGSEEVASEAISAGATDYLQKGSGTEQYDLLVNRIHNSVEQYRATRRADELDRVRTIASRIDQVLVRAKSRGEIESRVCEILSAADPYLFAWIGENSDEQRSVEARTGAGVEQGYLEAIEITTDDTATGQGPTGQAIETHDVAVMQDIAENPEYEPWRDEAIERGYRSSAAVPLVYDGTLYGVLNLYAERTDAFDERELDLLAELGTDIAHALHSFDVQAGLQEEREFIDQSLDALDDLFYVLRTDGALRRWNDRLSEVMGYTDEELAHMQATDLFPADEQETIADGIDETLTAGGATVEATISTSDGDRIPYEFTGSRLTDTDGDVVGLIGIGRDLTERKEQEHKREQIIDRVSDAIVEVDADWQFTLLNEQAEERHDMDEGNLLGRDFWEVFSEARDTRFEEKYRGVMETREPTSFTEYYVGLDGWFDIDVFPNDTGGVAFYFRDVTARVERSRELERRDERFQSDHEAADIGCWKIDARSPE